MAQFRTTADLVDIVLRKGGELTDGTSQYEADVLEDINTVHQTIINGGNEFGIDMAEAWPWAKAQDPIVLELQPKYEVGSVNIAKNGTSATLSASPGFLDFTDWFFKVDNHDDYFRVVYHSGTTLTLDSNYTGETNTAANYKLIKLDYKLESQMIVVQDHNSKLDFEEAAATPLVATLPKGSYTPDSYGSEVATQLGTAGANMYDVSYDALTGKFTVTSSGSTFNILAQSGTNQVRSGWQDLGMDIEDLTGSLTYSSTYRRDGVVRLYEPVTVYKQLGEEGNIYELPEVAFKKEFPFTQIREGTPTHYTQIKHTDDGSITIRFNRYPDEAIRVELDYIPVPIDLKNNEQSLPILPRSYIQILVYGGLFYLLTEKEDDKAKTYYDLAATKLAAMVKQYKRDKMRTGNMFGKPVARREQISGFVNRRRRWASNGDLD